VPKVKEATALAAAMAAGVGVGIYGSILKASEALVIWEKVYISNAENFKKYQEITVNWKKVYENQLTLVDEGLTESMWKAPGI
jgi:autoinducer 2 (AI-2) kinase